jgi:hypothetical protein
MVKLYCLNPDAKKRLGAECHVAALDSWPHDATDQPERRCRFRQNPTWGSHTVIRARIHPSFLNFPRASRSDPLRRSSPRPPAGRRQLPLIAFSYGPPPPRSFSEPELLARRLARAASAALRHHTPAHRWPRAAAGNCSRPHPFFLAEQQGAGHLHTGQQTARAAALDIGANPRSTMRQLR